MAMKEVSTQHAAYEEDLRAYAAAGFDAIGIEEEKLRPDDADNLLRLRRSRLAVAGCSIRLSAILQLQWGDLKGHAGPADPEERIASICASIRRFAPFEPASLTLTTGPRGDLGPAEAGALVCFGLQQAAAVATEMGVELALEPTHPRMAAKISLITTLDEAAALIDDAGTSSVKLALDTAHLGDQPAIFADIERHVDRLASVVDVSDMPASGPVPNRQLPGHGVGPTKEIVSTLRRCGWDGYLQVKLSARAAPDGGFWALPVDEAATRAYAAVTALLED